MKKTNKNYKKSQKGRSMVEMLGVLAIVGVLSVGGVYGYGVAMKKHKANELLHQASMLATTISAQIQSKGQLPQNIENFGDAKYGTFSTPTKANDEQFEMKITDMDSAVCEQMAKMSGGMVRKAECSETTLTLTYNNNLSSDKVAADYNGDETGEECTDAGYKWCNGLSTAACKKDCCSGITLNNCQESCDSSTGEITNKDDGTDCTTADGKKGTCSDGVCEETPTCLTSGSCMNNEGLCEGYYCKVGGSISHDTMEYTITAGDITALPSTIEKNGRYHIGGAMTWDAAYYYCEALSKIDDSITGMAKKDSFEPFGGEGYGWLNTLANGGSTPTSGNEYEAFYVDISSGSVNGYSRGNDSFFSALCE